MRDAVTAVVTGRCTTGGGTGGVAVRSAACGAPGTGDAGGRVGIDGAGGGDGFAVSGGTTFGAAVCALGAAGDGAPGFVGTAGASRKMTSERPPNPSATAATPFRTNVFSAGPALPPGERG